MRVRKRGIAVNISTVVISVALAIAAPSTSQSEQPKVIYFDFGGVMVQPNREMQLNYLIEELKFPKEAIQDSPHLCWMQLHPEEMKYLSQKASENQIVLSSDALEAYRKAKKDSLREIPGMKELVSNLREMGCEVNLITNIRPENLDLLEPFKPLFDCVILSPKDPGERGLWESQWIEHRLLPSQLLLIDDQLPNVEEAVKVGLQSFQFQNITALVDELIQRGLALAKQNDGN